jgi:hypothetical protein
MRRRLQSMSRLTNRADPFWFNSITAIKMDKRFLESGFHLSLSADALRLYLLICHAMGSKRNEFVIVAYSELFDSLGWIPEQSMGAAEELKATGLLMVNVSSYRLDFRLPALQ